ncbi:hypothetical protein ACLKA6_007078 [Drosophila palustris]
MILQELLLFVPITISGAQLSNDSVVFVHLISPAEKQQVLIGACVFQYSKPNTQPNHLYNTRPSRTPRSSIP